MHGVELYASHEALLLDYERALTRYEDGRGAYDLSAHFVWVGERTRAHRRRARGLRPPIANPIGVKLGPTTTVGGRRSPWSSGSTRTGPPGRLTLHQPDGCGPGPRRCCRRSSRR